jgi:hypothetical protein
MELRGPYGRLQLAPDLNVHNLFPGSYAQGQYGFVIGTMSRGDLWLQNQAGVVMHLKGKREGLMLSLGGDAMIINMTQ